MVAPASSSFASTSATARSVRARSAPGSSIASSATKSLRAKAPTAHYLGGSNNLISERSRRERAETALQRTKLSLHTVAEELTPQVEQLAHAIKTIQIEKHHRLDLDEASQEVLEALQQQLDEVETQQQGFPHIVEQRLDAMAQQIDKQRREDVHELKVLVANVQDAHDELATEFRLLHHELSASHEFLSQRMSAVDDAVESVRHDVARAAERQRTSNQLSSDRVSELDEKLFTLDKDVLRLKLALPSVVAAQLASPFTDCRSSNAMTIGATMVELPTGNVAMQQTLQAISAEIEALKTDAAAHRVADRTHLDGLANRVRDAAKSHQSLKKVLDARLQQLQSCCEEMTTKVSSELAKRLLAAQNMWDAELQHLRACVQLETSQACEAARDQRQRQNADATSDLDELLVAMQHKLETIDDLRTELSDVRAEVQLMSSGQDTTLKALNGTVQRVETDMLGLYDWSREKLAQLQEEVTYASAMLAYFNKHAKILPK